MSFRSEPTAQVHTLRLRRSVMADVKALAARNNMTAASYIASIIEEIAEEHVVITPIDQSQTRVDIAIPDPVWQKAMRIAATRNYRSLGDLVSARVEEEAREAQP